MTPPHHTRGSDICIVHSVMAGVPLVCGIYILSQRHPFRHAGTNAGYVYAACPELLIQKWSESKRTKHKSQENFPFSSSISCVSSSSLLLSALCVSFTKEDRDSPLPSPLPYASTRRSFVKYYLVVLTQSLCHSISQLVKTRRHASIACLL